ncbi:hypothetical protein N7478_011422 [Penicillium angulare]|uniref:uncharacterized protein n=1 Tax=Penicillium angulare TaxID=116970 RepID=UPI0025412005|nr:uncharacterized protein N7478_011422 [Penicillium angulare]KAJ5263817.1 hypothetical protein N7478_011422 [Penicillium angulare]
MTSTSFGDENSGTQVGTNHGPITHNYFSSGKTPEAIFKPGNIDWKPLSGPERLETPRQNIDNEVLKSLAFPQMLDRKDNIEPCHTNTCKWILELEEFQSWRCQSHGLLWVKGKPGAGKSTLMVFLHDKLQSFQDDSPAIHLHFFFTARGTEMQRTPLGMLRSLLSQIFDCDPTVRPQIREIYDRRCKQFGYGKRQWEWPQVMLEELLASVILVSAKQQHVMVFVDALDEAGAKSAQQLAGYFHRLVDRAEKKKLCIQVEDHNKQDIATYIQDKLIKTEAKDNTSQKMREMLVKQLTQQANGVFQWVHIIIPLIEQKEVPAGLEDTYVYILNNVIEKSNCEQSFLFFQWVYLAERPLTVTEMRYALVAKNVQTTPHPKRWERICGFIESNEDMLRRIKALSGGLAEVVSSWDNNETVQVVHQSVNDFLRTKGLKVLCHNIGMRTSSMNEDKIVSQCHGALYRTCLVYLTTVRIPAGTSGFKGTKEGFVQDHPLIHYATTNLFVHAEKALDFRSNVLPNEKEILQNVLSTWVQIYQTLDGQMLDGQNRLCPPRGTTLLHMAAAANLVDLIESLLSNHEDFAKINGDGDTAFHLAARGGHVTIGKILRRKGADQEAKNHGGYTPLFKAASGGRIEFVEWLLGEGVNLRINGNREALQAASFGGHESVVHILLGAGANVNAQGGEYGNALQAAVCGERPEIVQILLGAGADVNALGGKYGNALQAAATHKSPEIVQILLGAGADVNALGGKYGNALQAAATHKSPEIVQILLGAGADVNALGGKYGNALQAAATHKSPEIVQILLGAGADVNALGGKYGNALQAAAHIGSPEIVQILLGAGANVNAPGGYYGNALQAAAAAWRGSLEIVQVLLDAHADVNALGGKYGNALQAAAWNGSPEIVQILLGAGANVNAPGGYYGNALQAAATHKSPEIVQILLGAGADVNALGGKYGNALQAAAHIGSPEIVQILLGAGANVNAPGGYYGNALQAAATHKSPEIVQILLGAGADVNALGGKYGNALQAAAHIGSPEIVQILLGAGANVNAQGGEYGLPLLAAIYGGDADKVQLLLYAGADSLLADELGCTPLHIAASKNMLHMLHMLLTSCKLLSTWQFVMVTSVLLLPFSILVLILPSQMVMVDM